MRRLLQFNYMHGTVVIFWDLRTDCYTVEKCDKSFDKIIFKIGLSGN